MIEIKFDLAPKTDPAILQEQVDRMERRIREAVWNKHGHEDMRRSREAVQRLFHEYDLDNTRSVSLPEFEKIMARYNFVDMPEQIEALFNRYDRDGTGTLSYDEFAHSLFALDRGTVPPPMSNPVCRELLQRVRDTVLERANGDFRGLSRSLRIMDRNRTASLDGKELRVGLQHYGIELSNEDFLALFRHFDRTGDGTISVTEFVRTIRGPLSAWRKELVKRAYGVLDVNGSGVVDFADIASAYHVDRHPDVVSGAKTPEQVYKEFMSGWDKDSDGVVTLEEFYDYYGDIGASIDNDQYFELMIRNAWHIAGGEGAAANTSNLRALVTYTSGVQEVVTVKKDLGLDRKDIRAIEAALIRQGVRNILKVSVADAMES